MFAISSADLASARRLSEIDVMIPAETVMSKFPRIRLRADRIAVILGETCGLAPMCWITSAAASVLNRPAASVSGARDSDRRNVSPTSTPAN